MDPLSALIARARQGDRSALDELVRACREPLRALAERRLGRRLRARLDASDIVQQTLLLAARDFAAFQGTAEPELMAWLRRILEHTVIGAVRTHVAAQGRSVAQEAPLPAGPAELAAEQTSPSQKVARGQARLRFLAALERLPPDLGEAVRLRHVEGLPVDEIARRLQRTPLAAASLIKRGLALLRRQLGDLA
jgi:RNA polymerase sigma-70 factor (ECF subfamily)